MAVVTIAPFLLKEDNFPRGIRLDFPGRFSDIIWSATGNECHLLEDEPARTVCLQGFE